jgi:hypothetical protein
LLIASEVNGVWRINAEAISHTGYIIMRIAGGDFAYFRKDEKQFLPLTLDCLSPLLDL